AGDRVVARLRAQERDAGLVRRDLEGARDAEAEPAGAGALPRIADAHGIRVCQGGPRGPKRRPPKPGCPYDHGSSPGGRRNSPCPCPRSRKLKTSPNTFSVAG